MYFRMMVVAVAALVSCNCFAAGKAFAGPSRATAHSASMGAFHHSRLSAKHFRAARFGRWRHRNFGNAPYPVLWPDDCFIYDACDAGSNAPPTVPADWTGSLAHAPATNLAVPDCRWIPQTHDVPAERGGQRQVTITRCMPTPPLSEFGSDAAPSRSILDNGESDVTAGIGARAVEPGDSSNRRQGCREQTWTVPSEAGGRRTVVVSRC
jgi:hypothetical protein